MLNKINDFLWGWFMILLLSGTHIFMTIKTRFIQRKIFKAIRLSVTKEKSANGNISPFQSLTASLASTIGTGNIIGMGTAIALGGPGAVFWCWITGVFGIATKYAETLLALRHRIKKRDGTFSGGAMYILEYGLHAKWLGCLFAVFCVLASFGIGAGIQIHAISDIFCQTLDPQNDHTIILFTYRISTISLLTGLITSPIIGAIIFGGIKYIARLCEIIVPVMALLYISGCVFIILINKEYFIPAIKLILKSAFSVTAFAGGITGTSITAAARYGISRGLFSNESGLGSTPIIACSAQSRNAVRQALISATATFWDTVVVCLLSGVVLVSSMLKTPYEFQELEGARLMFAAFKQIPFAGTFILVLGIVMFAFSTIPGWSYYGERCVEYLFDEKAVVLYKKIFIAVLFISSIISLDTVWTLSDIFNALMAIPNIIAVLYLSDTVSIETNHYLYNNRLDSFD